MVGAIQTRANQASSSWRPCEPRGPCRAVTCADDDLIDGPGRRDPFIGRTDLLGFSNAKAWSAEQIFGVDDVKDTAGLEARWSKL
jgi:hypothetical protein